MGALQEGTQPRNSQVVLRRVLKLEDLDRGATCRRMVLRTSQTFSALLHLLSKPFYFTSHLRRVLVAMPLSEVPLCLSAIRHDSVGVEDKEGLIEWDSFQVGCGLKVVADHLPAKDAESTC